MLKKEGVEITNNKVDLKKYLFKLKWKHQTPV
jgi:hypothetical protein